MKFHQFRRHKRLKDENRQNLAWIRRQIRKQRVAFVSTELKAGINFCQAALSTSNADRKTRNIENAVNGYKTLRCFPDVLRALRNNCTFHQRLGRFKDLLHELGQEV